MTNLTAANTILAQLGGNKFLAMIGAKNLVGSADALHFDIPRGAKNKANKVRVSISSDDTYNVEFFRWNAKAFDLVTIGKRAGVYCDSLCSVFTAETGLLCAM